MDSETIAKMRADHDKRRHYENVASGLNAGDCCVGQAAPPMVCEAQRPRTAAEQTIYDLSQRAYDATVQGERAKKALDILQAHPEFLELIELIRTGMVSLY